MLLADFIRTQLRPALTAFENEQRALYLSDPKAQPIDREEREWWERYQIEVSKRVVKR